MPIDKPRTRKEAKLVSENVKRGLMSIYTNGDGSMPDISHLEVQHHSRLKAFFIGIILVSLVLSSVTWLGFILFNPNKSTSNKSIQLNFTAPQDIASGDEVIYSLEYKNIDKVTIKNVEIMVRYPDGFEFISAEPLADNSYNTSWKIGDLSRGDSGKIVIKGKLIGSVGEIKTITATASFRPENFSSDFKEGSQFSHQITSSILELAIEGPDKVLPQKKSIYKITYKNNSEQDLTNVKIIAIYPNNFIFQESNPKTFQAEGGQALNNEWRFETLAKKSEGTIEITGGFVADPKQNLADMKFQIGFVSENSDFSLQHEKIFQTEIVDTNLNLNLIINGSAQNQPIGFGQTLTYSLAYKNLGQKELDDVSFSVMIDSEIVDWETLEDKNGGKIDGNQITWGKDQISQFDLIRPLDEGTIDFSIKIKEGARIDLNKAKLIVVSKASASILKIGEIESPDVKIESSEIQNNINTDIDLKVEGRYFDDDNIAVGIGPLPPVVGQLTTFRIYWSISNSLHEVTDVVVKAILPQGVDWYDKQYIKTGNLKFDSATREVTWTIGRIPANKSYDDVNCWFDVSVTPTEKQLRKLIILIDQPTLTATDKSTETEITKTGKAITSNLEDDEIGGGKGLVIDITE